METITIIINLHPIQKPLILKKNKPYNNKTVAKTQGIPSDRVAVTDEQTIPSKFSLMYKLALLCGIFSFLLYSNTLHHEYTVDDGTVIKNNKITTQGTKAIPQIFKTAYK